MMQSAKEFYESKDLAGIPKYNTHDIANFEVFSSQLDEHLIQRFDLTIRDKFVFGASHVNIHHILPFAFAVL